MDLPEMDSVEALCSCEATPGALLARASAKGSRITASARAGIEMIGIALYILLRNLPTVQPRLHHDLNRHPHIETRTYGTSVDDTERERPELARYYRTRVKGAQYPPLRLGVRGAVEAGEA